MAGVPEIITLLVADIPNAQSGFRLTFSAAPFPGHKLVVTRGKAESGGFWYNVENSDQTGWLCPALFNFFPKAPRNCMSAPILSIKTAPNAKRDCNILL